MQKSKFNDLCQKQKSTRLAKSLDQSALPKSLPLVQFKSRWGITAELDTTASVSYLYHRADGPSTHLPVVNHDTLFQKRLHFSVMYGLT